VEQIAYWQTPEDFVRRQRLDREKAALCLENGVHLIIVPHTVKYLDLYAFIRSKCIGLPAGTPDLIDYSTLDLNNGFSRDAINDITGYIARNFGGGEVLSSIYHNCETPLQFRCKNGHEFEQTRSAVLSGIFCTVCSRNVRRDEHMRTNVLPTLQQHNLELVGTYDKSAQVLHWHCATCKIMRFHKSWDNLRLKLKEDADPCECNRNSAQPMIDTEDMGDA
jgi:hypothetical protein